ncbi:MAG TPA: hypothetical protein VJI98_02085 [Candidatus Nanoarchaeia archaeon]|nr:hypothetical protein [Candidatus Nanoarchaeia archaeon]
MIKQNINFGVSLGLGLIPVSLGSLAISELSPLELEVALDNGLAELKQESQQPEGNGNYFFSGKFYDKCRDARDSISQEELLKNPQIFVEVSADGNYTVGYNTSLIERIEQKLSEFQRVENYQPDQCFSLRVRESLGWTTRQQVTLVDYLVRQQADYIKSKNPMDLRSISLREAAEATSQSISTVDRLARNLSIQLPQGDRIFAKELITSGTIKYTQGVYLLKQLKQDTDVYEDSRWKASARQLVSLLQDRYGFRITDKPLTKYLRELELQETSATTQ